MFAHTLQHSSRTHKPSRWWTGLLLAVALCLHTNPLSAKIPGEEFTSLFGISLDQQTTLAEVGEKMGEAPMEEAGDAADYQASLCYKAKDGYVEFLSGELGGPEHYVAGVALLKTPPTKNCSQLPKDFYDQDLHLAGLKLGMTKANFSKVVGGKVKAKGTKVSAMFTYERPMTPEEHERFLSQADDQKADGQNPDTQSADKAATETNNENEPEAAQKKSSAQQDYFDGNITIEGQFSNEGLLTEVRVWRTETY